MKPLPNQSPRKHSIVLLILVAILNTLTLEAFAYDFEATNEDGVTMYYNYINGGKELEVTLKFYGGGMSESYSDYSGVVNIPDSVEYGGETLPVTRIGELAFYDCSSLTSVTIPSSVTSIGSCAFYDCSSLTAITIPNSVTSIGSGAFMYCNSLTSITIPSSVTSIGSCAFYDCSSLTAITIPNSVTSIKYCAFKYCSSLTSITIPNSVTSIDYCAFQYCSSLTSVSILGSVTSIGENAFEDCSSLTSVSIPNSVRFIGGEAFKKCTSLTTVTSLIKKPFSIKSSVFSGNTIYKGTLYVPKWTANKYKVIEGWKDFTNIEELDGASGEGETTICETPTISYSDGKLTFSCATEGVEYISEVTSEDIKKFYTDEVNLTATYCIKVYATKNGYTNSEVATATLCWLDAEPKTDGMATDITVAKGNAVMIQAQGGALHISGVAQGTRVEVYSLTGARVASQDVTGGSAVIPTGLRKGTIAIVRIGDTAMKVLMQ